MKVSFHNHSAIKPNEFATPDDFTAAMESDLDRILGQICVAQDPMGDEDAAVADLTNEGAEGLLVALSRLVHDRSQHPLLPGCRRRMAPSTSMSLDLA